MGKWLRAQGLVPDLVLASPARRARETASKVCKVLDIEKYTVHWAPRIYDATRADLIAVLADCPADRRLVLSSAWRKLTAASGRVEHWMCPKGLGEV